MGFIQDQPMQSVEVDFGDGSVTVYFRKMNLYEMDLIDKARDKGSVDGIVETIMVRARNENGNVLFSKADRSKIVRQYDPDEVLKLVNAMNAFDAEGPAGN